MPYVPTKQPPKHKNLNIFTYLLQYILKNVIYLLILTVRSLSIGW